MNEFFAEGGPLERFSRVTIIVLMCQLKLVEGAARSYYRRSHSNDQSGAQHENVPAWA